MARPMKSTYMISATGRLPVAAAPTATAAIASSELGVSRTRSAPNSSARPLVTPKMPPPPQPATSSPMTKTAESRRHGVLVVLTHVHHGQLPDGCQVRRLVQDALLERAVAEEAYGDRTLLL